MIYLYTGDDIVGSRAKLEATIATLLKKSPEAEVFRLNSENFSEEKLDELIVGQTLFYRKFLVVIDQLGGEEIATVQLLDRLPAIADSANIFFFLETDAESEFVKQLRALAKTEIKTNLDEEPKKKGFNLFAVSDAFSSKKRQDLWVIYHQALLAGFEPEEIFWKIEWALKNLLIVKTVTDPTATETGLAPFPLKKALREAKNFTVPELQELHSQLVSTYHEARYRSRDLGLGLEKFILGA